MDLGQHQWRELVGFGIGGHVGCLSPGRSLGSWPLVQCAERVALEGLGSRRVSPCARRQRGREDGIAIGAQALASRVIASIIEKDFAFSGYVEFAGESFVDQKLVGLICCCWSTTGSTGIEPCG